MHLQRHHQYILGLWFFWLSSLCFWAVAPGWFQPAALMLVIGLAILFGWVSAFVLGAAKYRQQPFHPLLDSPRTVPEIAIPTKKRTEWKRWQLVYQFICPLVTQGYAWEQIKAQLESNELYPNSIESIRKIYRAGQAGYLETWPPPK